MTRKSAIEKRNSALECRGTFLMIIFSIPQFPIEVNVIGIMFPPRFLLRQRGCKFRRKMAVSFRENLYDRGEVKDLHSQIPMVKYTQNKQLSTSQEKRQK